MRITLIVMLLVNSFSFAQHGLKEEAKTFSLTVIETYFNNDCESFYQSFSDTIWVLDGDGIITREKFKSRLCEVLESAIRDKTKTMINYEADYEIQLLNLDNITGKFDEKMPSYYISDPTDYFFIGYNPKPGFDEVNDGYIWDDMFVFLIRKENDKWVIKGVSG